MILKVCLSKNINTSSRNNGQTFSVWSGDACDYDHPYAAAGAPCDTEGVSSNNISESSIHGSGNGTGYCIVSGDGGDDKDGFPSDADSGAHWIHGVSRSNKIYIIGYRCS